MTVGVIVNNVNLFMQLRDYCHRLLSEDVSIEVFQGKIREIESAMTSCEDRKNRDFLTWVEGELELVLYTVGSQLQRNESNSIAKKVLSWLDAMNS